jgi:hypothetical protein
MGDDVAGRGHAEIGSGGASPYRSFAQPLRRGVPRRRYGIAPAIWRLISITSSLNKRTSPG